MDDLERRRHLAGAESWTVDRILATKVFLGAVAAVLCGLAVFTANPSAPCLSPGQLFVAAGFYAPELLLGARGRKRQAEIERGVSRCARPTHDLRRGRPRFGCRARPLGGVGDGSDRRGAHPCAAGHSARRESPDRAGVAGQAHRRCRCPALRRRARSGKPLRRTGLPTPCGRRRSTPATAGAPGPRNGPRRCR